MSGAYQCFDAQHRRGGRDRLSQNAPRGRQRVSDRPIAQGNRATLNGVEPCSLIQWPGRPRDGRTPIISGVDRNAVDDRTTAHNDRPHRKPNGVGLPSATMAAFERCTDARKGDASTRDDPGDRGLP